MKQMTERCHLLNLIIIGHKIIRFWIRVQCHDAIIKNEINLFGLARVEDKCKTQKKIYRVRDNPIMTLDEDQNIFLITSVIYSL